MAATAATFEPVTVALLILAEALESSGSSMVTSPPAMVLVSASKLPWLISTILLLVKVA